ncbi:ASCH domain-containing protein [Rosenbergiella sp. S61]|uniref:ASCH domain-containing protein n=1 Tax=Rosenbergiella gaditana TaxID=2726987 RepID=A0ABS5SX34_9GAMM|nr:ASCH domain-containing protein [Rosenbergiella gaditana]MBT0724497.1 ASCH domain-containing protein [Rosenbergiella gaditana]
MTLLNKLQTKYPGALAWGFGDSAEMADELANHVVEGRKTASCGSLASYLSEASPPTVGSYHIILNGREEPVCIIRIIAMRIVLFREVEAEFAYKEGEGDRSLNYWQQEHKAFFTREGSYSEAMELVAEEFELIEVL